MTKRLGAAPAGVAPVRRSPNQRGMVTVELAIGFLTVVLMAGALAGVLLIGVVKAGCDRASTEMARQYARGDGEAAARAEAEAPDGARAVVDKGADGVSVTVTAPVSVLGLGEMEISGEAWSRWEPGATP